MRVEIVQLMRPALCDFIPAKNTNPKGWNCSTSNGATVCTGPVKVGQNGHSSTAPANGGNDDKVDKPIYARTDTAGDGPRETVTSYNLDDWTDDDGKSVPRPNDGGAASNGPDNSGPAVASDDNKNNNNDDSDNDGNPWDNLSKPDPDSDSPGGPKSKPDAVARLSSQAAADPAVRQSVFERPADDGSPGTPQSRIKTSLAITRASQSTINPAARQAIFEMPDPDGNSPGSPKSKTDTAAAATQLVRQLNADTAARQLFALETRGSAVVGKGATNLHTQIVAAHADAVFASTNSFGSQSALFE